MEGLSWSMPGLENRSVIVTGGGSGIGAASARALVDAGSRVLLVDRDDSGLAKTREGLDPSRVHTLTIDIAGVEAPQRIVDAALKAYGEITTVLNIAGVIAPAFIPDATREQMKFQFGVNLEAPFWLTQAALPHLKRGSQVILCASTAGFVGSAGGVLYCAAKTGVIGMMRAMAAELAGQGIRVNAIAPGTTDTPINDPLFAIPGWREHVLKAIPDRRIAIAEDHVGAVAFLVSDLSDHVHGHAVVIDGGHIAI
jgi:NAD(P)-dependent dehydrogenase (short-subunit alcohol dehydrogenase family)